MPTSFKDFKKLGPRVWLYNPELSVPGQLIIICSWADARRRHIAKYIDLYKTIAPEARILLIQSSPFNLVSSYARQRASLKPAVQFILDEVLLHPKPRLDDPERKGRTRSSNEPKILLHSFSNGGGLTATQLLFLLREATHASLPLVGIIMDSSPDGGTYKQTHNAIVIAQPRSPLQKAVVALMAHAVLLPIWASYAVGRDENSQTVMRRVFLDTDYVGTTNICYLYSKEDQMTDWKDVHSHAEEARKNGWTVDELEFQGSSHCAHMGADKERYTTAVRKIWDGMPRQSKL